MHVFPLSGRKKQEKKAGRTCSQSWSRPRDREYPSEMQSFRHEFKAFPPGKDAIAIDQMSRMSDSIFKERSGYERSGYAFAFPRRETHEFHIRLVPPQTEGAGKAGCSARTHAPCALVES